MNKLKKCSGGVMATNLIKIENCNNIKECDFTINDDTLNIKYAINGTGKSTISKAIKLTACKEKMDVFSSTPVFIK